MRTSGILMHISSLPSPYGIGTMGEAARVFIRFLHSAGQTWWQILPICPTGFGDSPYQTFSTYAGNPYLIDLDDLAEDGLLMPAEYTSLDWGDEEGVDYGRLYQMRYPILRLAANRFLNRMPAEYQVFCRRNAFWLEDYAIFMTIKGLHNGSAWERWETPLRNREYGAIRQIAMEYQEEVNFWSVVQFFFFNQWQKLKAYANSQGVRVIGDLPIYVSYDSADVWAHPEQFQLDNNHKPIEVAGCPPDGFSEDGQLWGNPLFDWDNMEREGFFWWIQRISYHCKTYDALRIDHFRGFDSYYAIPYNALTAQNGRWRKGPGIKLFEAVKKSIGQQNIIAEDLGFLTQSVHALREKTGFPGMKVLEFAFDSRENSSSEYLPHNIPPHCVAYIGTHDNDTAVGWMEHAPDADANYAKEYLRLSTAEGWQWGMMRSLWACPADTVIVQMQDVLGLGSSARMNVPSTVGNNWRWRAKKEFDTSGLAEKLRHEMKLYWRLIGAGE